MSYQNLILLNASIPQTKYDKKKKEEDHDPDKPIDFNSFIGMHGGKKG